MLGLLDGTPSFSGYCAQSWMSIFILGVSGSPPLFLMCLGPELDPLPHPQGFGAYPKRLPYSFLECWAHNWVPSLILRESGTRSSPTISLDFPLSCRSPKPVEDLGGLQLIPPIMLVWMDGQMEPRQDSRSPWRRVLSWKFCLDPFL